jgi:hypothetical protein
MQTPSSVVGRSRSYRRGLTLFALVAMPIILPLLMARAVVRMGYVLVTGEVPSF